MAAGLRLTSENQQCVDSHGQSLLVWLKNFVDAAAIQRSEHFNSNASATTTPRTAAGLPATPFGALVRKRPAADRAPCAPREPRPALPSVSAVGIVPRAEAEVPFPRATLVTASDRAQQRMVRAVRRALQQQRLAIMCVSVAFNLLPSYRRFLQCTSHHANLSGSYLSRNCIHMGSVL